MAKMNPSVRPDNPPGERQVYEVLESLPGTQSWRVYHSLNIASHATQERGEADFVIVIPGTGILCLEVKSHTSVSRGSDGLWKLGRQTGQKPFSQAANNARSIRDFLQDQGVLPPATPVAEAVWFTHCEVPQHVRCSIEFHAETLMDRSDFRDRLKNRLAAIVQKSHDRLAARYSSFDRPCELSGKSLNDVCRTLRPRFDASMCLVKAGEEERLALQDEQYEALDVMEDNRAVVFTGPAGTGKTVLAAEKLARSVASGKSAALICFNRALADNLKSRLPGLKDAYIGTFHELLISIADINIPKSADKHFWAVTLPQAAEAVIKRGDFQPFDYLLVDEAQDLASPEHLSTLDDLVAGGLTAGNLALFGDFEHQAIYSQSHGQTLTSVTDLIPGLCVYRLKRNYRNLPRVGGVFESLCQTDKVYTTYRRRDDHTDPIVYSYTETPQQQAALSKALKKLQEEGFSPENIVVLSPRGAGKGTQLIPRQRRKSLPTLQYSSIHKFKGLEAPAVIITDVDQTIGRNFVQVLGVGVTRALERLVLIAHEDTRREFLDDLPHLNTTPTAPG